MTKMNKHIGMLFILVELCVIVTVGNAAPVKKIMTKDEAIEYLKRYNYIKSDVAVVRTKALAKAVRKFQEMVNLNATGELNKETLNTMAKPRCGNQDIINDETEVPSWPKKKLSWKITNYATTNKLTQAKQRDAMTRALNVWATKTRLRFKYVADPNNTADLNIQFLSEDLDDGYIFDGRGGVLAHAQFPTNGSVYFDDEENWILGTKAETKGAELFIVAAHEFGHALGLGHTKVLGSLMHPIYSYSSNMTLHQNDIDAIQDLYGMPRTRRISS